MADRDFIPYGRQEIDQADVEAVVEVLRSDFLTQGPWVARLEAALAEKVGASQAVAVANGTAALHLSALALGLRPGQAWITSPLTFVATANAARYAGATPLFGDVDETGCLDPATVGPAAARARRLGLEPKVVAGVDLTGQPADWTGLRAAAAAEGLSLVDDGCHALGARWRDREGAWRLIGQDGGAQATVFSFHPVKHVTTGEGGAVATDSAELAERIRILRSHGITRAGFSQPEMALDPAGRTNPWYYEQQTLGFNYRLTDLQAALGLSQLKRLDDFLARRRFLAAAYDRKLNGLPHVRPLERRPGVEPAYHLYAVRIDFPAAGVGRAEVMNRLRQAGIGTQVHYIPVHLQPDFRRALGTGPGDCPRAEALYQELLSLPLYPGLSPADQDRVVAGLARILGA